MNWGLIKRSQLNTRPAPSLLLCTTAEEADIDYVFLRLQKLEEMVRLLRKECKNLKDCLNNLALSEKKLTSNLSSFTLVHEDENLRTTVENYHSVNKQMTDCAKSFSNTTQVAVIEPLKLFWNEFGSVQAAIKKRDQIIAELPPLRKQLEKTRERERTGTNLARMEQLKRSLSTIENEFKATNKQLLSDMSAMFDLRVDYFEPSLIALIKSEVEYYGECTKLFTALVQSSASANTGAAPSSVITEPQSSELIAEHNEDMLAIRSLSIVAGR